MAINDRRRFDWGTPLSIFIMTAVLATLGWGGERVLNDIKEYQLIGIENINSSVNQIRQDNKEAHEKIWNILIKNQDRLNCIVMATAKCCPNSICI